MEDYIRVFQGVDGQPLHYGLRDDLEPPAVSSDTMNRANGTKYFTHDEYMISCGLILSGTVVFRSDPKYVGPFTDLFITNRALIWDKMVAILGIKCMNVPEAIQETS